MSLYSRWTAALLIFAVTITLLGASAMGEPAMQSGRAPHCHDSHPGSPAPAPGKSPANYQCCANGHTSAVVSTAFSLERLSAFVLILPTDSAHAASFDGQVKTANLVLPPPSSFGSSPLRI